MASAGANVYVKVFRSLCAALVLYGFVLQPVSAQDTPREVRARLAMFLGKGAFADAIPLLQQMVEWFGTSSKESTIIEMDRVHYHLGLCYFFIGQFGEARAALLNYQKKFPRGISVAEAAVYYADAFRYDNMPDKALAAYEDALRRHIYYPDLEADILAGMARCHLAGEKWDKAMPVLLRLYEVAPDFERRNWAATYLTTAYLKERKLGNVYRLMTYLLAPESFAARSVGMNMAALETADDLFSIEKYRDALWVYRVVYPKDILSANCQRHLEYLQRYAEQLRQAALNPRLLMRVQESIGEVEAQLQAIRDIPDYDIDLHYRIGRAYMEIFRYREAQEVFLYLYKQFEGERAEEALYLAFECAAHIQPWDRAFELGEEYCKVYPAGRYYDRITLMMGQMYARLEDWPKVIETLTTALAINPKHEDAAECMYLIGYASFMEEKFADAVTWLRRMNTTYPDNPRKVDGYYWLGMALMFDKKFEEAAKEFDMILLHHQDSQYRLDAEFRRAVCSFGAGNFEDAGTRFDRFVTSYPTNKLSGEAYMMLGDIAGNFGELPQAVRHYRKSAEYDINIEYYNYVSFRAGEILEELKQYKPMADHFKGYIAANREGANLPLAQYWVGRALWGLGQQREAMDFLFKAIETYGDSPNAIGTDMIVEEWISRTKSTSKLLRDSAWNDLATLLQRAEVSRKRTLALRLKRALLYAPDTDEEKRRALMAAIVNTTNLSFASPDILQLVMDEAQKVTNAALVSAAAEQAIKAFPETDVAVGARLVLARQAVDRDDFDTAVRHLGIIREVFPNSAEAADALMLLGDIYRRQSKYAQADECYKAVLAVREWRGPRWPAALYGRGECSRLQRNYEQASAYFERIYLLYSSYRTWAAQAYLARAQCLAALSQYDKAAETLKEMLANRELAESPEGASALKLQADIKRFIP